MQQILAFFPIPAWVRGLRLLVYQGNCVKEFGQLPYSFFKNENFSINISPNLDYCICGHHTGFGFFLDTGGC
jgi:hypothetical protein